MRALAELQGDSHEQREARRKKEADFRRLLDEQRRRDERRKKKEADEKRKLDEKDAAAFGTLAGSIAGDASLAKYRERHFPDPEAWAALS